MYRRIAGYMKENHMTEAGYTVLAGVSGGSDSMLMLTILRELQKPLDFKLAGCACTSWDPWTGGRQGQGFCRADL